jgi:hypothetical protein
MFLGVVAAFGCAELTDPSAKEEPVRTVYNSLTHNPPDEAELARMRDYIANRYPAGAVRGTFEDAGGVTFDCVDFDKQPALQGHSVGPGGPPPVPSNLQPIPPGRAAFANEGLDSDGRARKCVHGTVPIARLSLESLAAAGSLDAYLNRRHDGFRPPAVARNEHAAYKSGATNLGAYARFGIWSPFVERSDEFSLVQLWV